MEGDHWNSKRHSIGQPMNTYMSRMSSSSSFSGLEKPRTLTKTSHTVDGRKTFLPRWNFPLASARSGCIFPGG